MSMSFMAIKLMCRRASSRKHKLILLRALVAMAMAVEEGHKCISEERGTRLIEITQRERAGLGLAGRDATRPALWLRF
jgi:hypothetical protein